ncbi:RHS repeat-associated core domain-containing protein [Pseudomonas sp. SWRI179]|uniref:RHS repeat-associated core domain-containing protein n=1 Tax=Pseudomonas sp. SWRI179 TaxID=2745497 RepID=UPI001EE23DFE|nr:RHS repeat-associated core domain-containing protein [Pseudomonas sp. SWRI179]
MPTTPQQTVLCRYSYDPLDRLVDCAPSAEAGIQRFYCKSRLATEIQGAVQRNVFQHEDQLLAQLQREDAKVDTALLATDQQRSVLNVLDANRLHPLIYTPYGHRPPGNGLLSLLGFNGERPDPVTGHYLLGNGYRGFNPVLMRFNTPDSWSPFGKGGLNAYTYCENDPINKEDPTGHLPLLRQLRRLFGTKISIKDTVSAIEGGAKVKTGERTIARRTLKSTEKTIQLDKYKKDEILSISESLNNNSDELYNNRINPTIPIGTPNKINNPLRLKIDELTDWFPPGPSRSVRIKHLGDSIGLRRSVDETISARALEAAPSSNIQKIRAI